MWYQWDAKCCKLHPELKAKSEEDRKKRDEAKKSGAATTQRNGQSTPFNLQVPKPSVGVLGFQSGLMGASLLKAVVAGTQPMPTMTTSLGTAALIPLPEQLSSLQTTQRLTRDSIVSDTVAASHTFNNPKWFLSMVPYKNPKVSHVQGC